MSVVSNKSTLAIIPGILGLSIGLFLTNRSFKSIILSTLDHIGSFLSILSMKSFHDGLGDVEEFKKAVDALNQETIDKAVITDMKIGEWHTKDGISYARASFTTPIGYLLPNEKNTQLAQVEIVIPAGSSFESLLQQGASVVLHLPATGDEGFSMRRKYIAKPLAVKHQIISIIIQIPFYGSRRVSSQHNFTLPVAEYMAKQSFAAVAESNALIHWLHTTYPSFTGKIGITGISFGASMAALSSLHCTVPHAVIAHVPANSPADAYVQGCLARTVAWHTIPAGKQTLYDLFALMDIAKVSQLLKEQSNDSDNNNSSNSNNHSQKAVTLPQRTYIQITALHDLYIPHHSSMKLYEHMKELPKLQYTKLHVLPGGHGSAILLDHPFYVTCIVEGLEKLIV